MLRSLFRRRILLIAALSLIAAGPAYAVLQFLPGQIWPAAVPVTPAAAYNMPVTISPGTYGDVIAGIEVGRDDRSPFVAITVLFTGTPPAGLVPNPIIGALGPFMPILPGFPLVPGYPNPIPPPGGRFYLRFVYRPINDPANPGWGPLPGAAGQLDDAMQTCLAVAAELNAFRLAAQLGTGAPVFPANPAMPPASLYLEFNPNGGVSQMEFYKFHVIRYV